LLEGTHDNNSKTFSFVKTEHISQQCIKHGTITKFVVKKGDIGLAWEDNQPMFFEEGVYLKDNPMFIFVKTASAAEKQIVLGSKNIITVWDGEVGVSYLKGRLVVLKPNRHLIDSAEHVFRGFLSTQQQTLQLFTPKTESEGLLTCETKDFVEIGLKADVFFKIADPEKTLLVVGQENCALLVRDTAIATLNSIIRSTSLAEVAQNKEIAARSERIANQSKGSPYAPSAPLFFDKVHDEFISRLHDSFMDRFGIEMTNIRIESFRIISTELATNMSKQAFLTAQTESQLSNLAGQTEIATAQQKRDAEVANIKAVGEAVKLQTETDAKNRTILEVARADAEATVVKAKAESQAIELRAQAEAKSILLRAEAEAKRAEMLSQTPLGPQIQLYAMYVEMVKNSVGGVPKVMVMPNDTANNPLNFFSFQQGQVPGLTPLLNQPSNTGKKNYN